MDINNLIKEELISISEDSLNKEQAINYLGDIMVENNYIKKEYIYDVLEREVNFPTGLELQNIGIAIPHANPDNVLSSGISVLKLKDKVVFSGMENGNDVYVDMIFMLALNNSNDHIKMLQNLFVMFQKEEVMENLINSKTIEEIKSIILNNLKEVA